MFLFNGIRKEPDNNTGINDDGDNNFMNNFFKINFKQKREKPAHIHKYLRELFVTGGRLPN